MAFQKQRDCSCYLGTCVCDYNELQNEATSYSPYFLKHGREAICPTDNFLGTPQDNATVNGSAFANGLVCRLKNAFSVISRHSETQVKRMKKNYDMHAKRKSFQKGDYEWYYSPRCYSRRSPKWSRFYVGPKRVVRTLSNGNLNTGKRREASPWLLTSKSCVSIMECHQNVGRI
jgi:hypothetical protein